MHGLHFPEPGVAGQRAQHPQAHFIQQGQHMPEFAGNVVFADQIDVMNLETGIFGVGRQGIRIAATYHMIDHRVAGNAVAEIFRAVKAGAIDGNHRHAPSLASLLANGIEIVADQGRHACVINEDRRWIEAINGLLDGVKHALFAAPHHHVLLG